MLMTRSTGTPARTHAHVTSVRVVYNSEDKVGYKWTMVQVAGSQRSINM